jgi:hypothetical protein
MPTGYTAKLEEKGQTFAEFVWTCARAFGALITMREDSLDAPIPEAFQPEPYAERSLREAKAELERVRKMTLKEAEKEAAASFVERKAEVEKHNVKVRAILARYKAMEAEVRAWVPPTPDHDGLRNFMLQQIKESTQYTHESKVPARLSAAEWREQRLASAARDVAYYEKSWAEEQERTRSRNKWLNDLRCSVPVPTGKSTKARNG